jgi:hypothetical protein
MKQLAFAVLWIVIPLPVLTSICVTSTLGQQDATGLECSDPRSIGCRAKVASTVQASFNANFPNIRVQAAGDVIVFADPKLFEKQEDRTSYRSVIQSTGMEKQLCTFGFKKVRFESSATTLIPKQEYDLGCPGIGESKAEVAMGAAPTSPKEPASQAAQETHQQVTGKVFAITGGGDLKPARMARVYLLQGCEHGPCASLTYMNKLGDKLRAQLKAHDFSCRVDLLTRLDALKETLTEWSTKSDNAIQVQFGSTDEEGVFQFQKVLPNSEPYFVLVSGRAGANDAWWQGEVKVDPGKDATTKLGSPEKACLD